MKRFLCVVLSLVMALSSTMVVAAEGIEEESHVWANEYELELSSDVIEETAGEIIGETVETEVIEEETSEEYEEVLTEADDLEEPVEAGAEAKAEAEAEAEAETSDEVELLEELSEEFSEESEILEDVADDSEFLEELSEDELLEELSDDEVLEELTDDDEDDDEDDEVITDEDEETEDTDAEAEDESDDEYDLDASEIVASGKCGAKATYEITGNKTDGYTLNINGSGKMDNCSLLYTEYRSYIKYIKISSRITSIGRYAFQNCSKVTSVEIPNSVTIIDIGAFKGCTKLSSVNVPKNLKKLQMEAFRDCTSLKNFNIPSGVSFDPANSGASWLFQGCTSLEEVTIGANFFQWWNTGMFKGCTNLKTVNILYVKGFKDGNIYYDTFRNCTSLESIKLPKDCFCKISGASEYEGSGGAFYGCTKLKSINIPRSVKTIENYAFSGCSKKNLVIRCFNGTEGAKFAEKNGFAYFLLPSGAYNILFDINSGDEGSTSGMAEVKCGKSVALTANGFEKTGYYFDSWNTKPDGTGKKYKNKAKVKNIANEGETITLYAIFKPMKYTFYFKGNKSSSGKMSSIKCTYGNSYTFKPNAFKKKGYTFVEWNTKADGTGLRFVENWSGSYIPEKNNEKIYMYAQWRANKYSVEFNGNSADNGNTAKMQNCEYGTTFNLTQNGFSKTGYTFSSWNTKANGKGKKYKNLAAVKNLTATDNGAVTLYAIWTPIKYNIAFKDNGAYAKGKTVLQKSVIYDKSVRLKSNSFKRKGYDFIGWNTQPNGSGDSYTNKQVVQNLCTQSGDTLTLYAQWRVK